MGRLATLSDPEFRKAAIDAGIMPPAGTIPLDGVIDVAIHAKGKTLDDCASALAKALGIEVTRDVSLDIEALVTAIGRIGRRVTIMIDALDEAASEQASAIAARLVVPLGRLARVRVLIGSRHSIEGAIVPQGEDRHARLRAAFGTDAIIEDLGDEAETREDIAEYVRSRLLSSTKHRGNSTGIAAAAERVAARADGVFLFARIVSRTLQELDSLDGELPSTALEAFAHDLQTRFGGERQRVDDLLAALAWGEGNGLTRRVWPLVANAVVTRQRTYNDDAVAWVLGHAGWHIIEAGEDGQAVYRLAHQALADYYRHRVDIGEAQGRIVAALTKGIAGAGWLDCDRYLWRHLSDHAAQAGRLDALIRDPGYLATADPARLVTVLPVIQDKGARRFADIYNRVADRLIRRPPLERLPLVHMTAQMEAPDLAPRLEPPVPTSWRCRWARVSSSSPHRIIGRHSAGVRAIALGTIDGRAVVISGSDDHSVRIWDPRTGIQIGKPLSGHSLGVSAVALGAVDDGVIVASGSWDQTIQLWDARTGEPIGKPLHGHNPVRGLSLEYPKERQRQHDLVRGIGGPYTGIEESRTSGILNVAFGTVNGRTIVASAGEDGTIRLWDARKGESFGEVLEGHTDAVSAVVFSEIDNHAIVVSGSWDGTIRRWNACSGEPIGEPLKGHTDAINAITLGVIDGVSVIVSGSRDGTIRSWHAETGAPIGRRIDWLEGLAIPAVAIGRVNGDPTVVWAPAFQNAIYLSDAHTGEIRRTLRGHQDDVGTIAVGAIDGRVVVVSGSVDGTVRLWDPRTEEPVRESTVTVRALAFATIEGRPIVASAGWDGNVLLWDAKTGDRFGSLIEGHRECAEAIALGEMDGHPVVVSGDEDHTIRLWDARTGKPIREPLRTEHPVKKVALGVVNGDPFLVSAGWEDLRLWTPLIGKPNSREFGERSPRAS
jgi:WD40 repeat protein